MRPSVSLLACALVALASAAALPEDGDRSTSGAPAIPNTRHSALDARIDGVETPRCRLSSRGQDLIVCAEDGAEGALLDALDDNGQTGKHEHTDPNDTRRKGRKKAEDGGGDGDKADDGVDDGENEFSPHVPISDGRRRAGMLGIFGVIVLSSAFIYFICTHQPRIRALIASIPSSLSSLKPNMLSLRSFSLPTLTVPPRTRRRRRPRGFKGFRPQVARLRAWATEDGVLDDAYEHGLFADTESFDDDLEDNSAGLDLGADEDFMIGAPRRIGNGKGGVLFDVGELETDEALPLAPSPRKFGVGIKGYGSAG